MNKINVIIIGVGAFAALAISLPLEWMTIRNIQMQFDSNIMLSRQFDGGLTASVTGLNGHITFLAQFPIWLIITVGMVGVFMAFMNSLGVASMPKFVPLIPLSFSALYIIVAFLLTIDNPNAPIGLGVFIALLGIALGYILALTNLSQNKNMSK